MVYTDYNNINWSEHFYADPTSPSGLRWARKVASGRNYSSIRYNIGDIAGCITKRSKGPVCWDVMVNRIAYKVHRILWCLHHKTISSRLIIDHLNGNPLDNSIDNLRETTKKINSHNVKGSGRSTTGVCGVNYVTTGLYGYYRAAWFDMNGKKRAKFFSTLKYGNDEAFRLASEHRAYQIRLLNESGAGYTDRHGL